MLIWHAVLQLIGVLYIEDNPKNNVMVCGNLTSSFDQLCNFAI